MRLTLENVGKIGRASVEINGITVIAGENNTGKSTVGKALYCLFSAFHNINDKINDERINSIYRTISIPFRGGLNSRSNQFRKIAKTIYENKAEYLDNKEKLVDFILEIYKPPYTLFDNNDEFSVESICDKIISYLKLDDNIIKSNVLKKFLNAEYNMQIGYVNADDCLSSMSLEIHNENSIDINIINDDIIEINRSIDIYSTIAYIEDPFIVDELDNLFPFFINNIDNHRRKLAEMITKKRKGTVVSNVIEEMVVSEKLNHIFEILNKICDGNLVETEDSYAYTSSKYNKPLPLSNISTGFKTFLIMKTLLMNGALEEKGTIILDEPEIHLHPEWQLLFAELIVLLQKEFGVHILLNTHSPYFLRAIQVYSAKYNIADICKYYLSEIIEDRTNIKDVTKCIESIYEKLSDPLQKLEDEEWNDD